MRNGRWTMVIGAAALVLMMRPGLAAEQATSLPPAAAGHVEALPVPDWLAWRVFQDSLTYYRGRSAAAVERMLAERAGLTPAQTVALATAGQAYVTALARIDADARAEVQARYAISPPGPDATLPRPEAVPGSRPANSVIRAEWGTTLFERVRASGLYDQVEARKRAALAAHLGALMAALGAPAVTQLTTLVQTTVTPTIRIGVLPAPAPPIPLPPGAVRTPPPGARIRPGDER
jgi:hypothetical protein